jgi:hypothetical protein
VAGSKIMESTIDPMKSAMQTVKDKKVCFLKDPLVPEVLPKAAEFQL